MHKIKPALLLIMNIAPKRKSKPRERKWCKCPSQNTVDTTFPSVHIPEKTNHQTESKYNAILLSPPLSTSPSPTRDSPGICLSHQTTL
jgi:hypothetical protein